MVLTSMIASAEDDLTDKELNALYCMTVFKPELRPIMEARQSGVLQAEALEKFGTDENMIYVVRQAYSSRVYENEARRELEIQRFELNMYIECIDITGLE